MFFIIRNTSAHYISVVTSPPPPENIGNERFKEINLEKYLQIWNVIENVVFAS